jgi:hypothetical protein
MSLKYVVATTTTTTNDEKSTILTSESSTEEQRWEKTLPSPSTNHLADINESDTKSHSKEEEPDYYKNGLIDNHQISLAPVITTPLAFSRKSISELYTSIPKEQMPATVGVVSSEDPTLEEDMDDYTFWRPIDAIYEYYRKYVDHHASFGPDPSLHPYAREALWPSK